MWHAWEREEMCTGFWWESPKEKIPVGRPRSRWEDGIKMDLRKIGWRGVEWIYLAQDTDCWQALVNAVMNLRVLAPRSWLLESFISETKFIIHRPQLGWFDWILSLGFMPVKHNRTLIRK
jgi:hypothetical protein